MSSSLKAVFVSGHRNPDIDSLAAAIALAELRRRQGTPLAQAVCPGVLSERARFLLQRFRVPEPLCRNDVYVRVADVMEPNPPVVPAGKTLWEGFRILRESGMSRLPVVDARGVYQGMLSPMGVLNQLLGLGEEEGSQRLASREVHASVNLIASALDGTTVTAEAPDEMVRFQVYVAAMQVQSFDAHLPWEMRRRLAVIVGDRPDIQEHVIERRVRLLIVTGGHPVEPRLAEKAKELGVTVLESPGDSAQVIRRLAFAPPVENSGLRGHTLVLSPEDRLRDVAARVSAHFEDVIPVLHPSGGTLAGIILKKDVTQPPPFQMILVDHNEIEQSLPGVESLPVVEVVDHHRLKTMPTDQPIRFTADVVGSTCTLISRMYKDAGESLSPSLAGMLLAGIVTDTLNLKSPTTTERDVKAVAWLEKLAGCTAAGLMEELSTIASPLAVQDALAVLNGDRKSYTEGEWSFALAQVEESNLLLLNQRQEELEAAMGEVMRQEKLDFLGLLVTDAVRENSRMLLLGPDALGQALPYACPSPRLYDLPGVLSRKKQLLPQVLAALRTLPAT
ncbi:MAG: putative manganese-dependent inorganic diphosphatase [Oligosphaeraceae bacterium]